MMSSLDHDVILYAAAENEADCAELVACADYPVELPSIPPFDANSALFTEFNNKAIGAMRERIEPGDLICIIGGLAQKPIADAFQENVTIEYGVGYGGVFSNFRVFESYAWMHTVYGAQTGGDPHQADGRFYDAVIPNSYDVADFPFCGDRQFDYLAYVGRMVDRKGIHVAKQIADRAGLPLHAAGIGEAPEGVHHYGVIGPERRAELMGGARALLCPTLYVEPFGGAAVEAQLCGTPVISTDWGAFTETIEHGVTGYRCRTLGEMVAAVEEVDGLIPEKIRDRAIKRYSTERVRWQYQDYLDQIATLREDGWFTTSPGRIRCAERSLT